MIKSFTQYYQDTNKIYEFKVRLAVECTPKLVERITAVLEAYSLESISKPKRLPIQEDVINFPKLGPVEISMLDVKVKYPAISEDIQHILYERAGIPMTHVAVYTEAMSDTREPKPEEEQSGEALLNTPYKDDTDAEGVYGNEYVSAFLDSIETREMPFDVPSAEKATTTNDIPQGTESPLTQQNTIPDPMKQN